MSTSVTIESSEGTQNIGEVEWNQIREGLYIRLREPDFNLVAVPIFTHFSTLKRLIWLTIQCNEEGQEERGYLEGCDNIAIRKTKSVKQVSNSGV